MPDDTQIVPGCTLQLSFFFVQGLLFVRDVPPFFFRSVVHDVAELAKLDGPKSFF